MPYMRDRSLLHTVQKVRPYTATRSASAAIPVQAMCVSGKKVDVEAGSVTRRATLMQDFGTLTQAQFGSAGGYTAGNSGQDADHVQHRRRRHGNRARQPRRAREPTKLMSCLRERTAGVVEIGQLSRLTKSLSGSVEDTITSSLRSLRKDMGESRRERQRVEREKADQEARQAARRATAKLNDINARSSKKQQHNDGETSIWTRQTRKRSGDKRPTFISTVNAAEAKNAIAMAPRPHSPFHGAACVDGFRSLKPTRGRPPFLAGDKSSNLAPVGTTQMKSSTTGNSNAVAHVWRAKCSMPPAPAGATAAASLPGPAFHTMPGTMTPSQSQGQPKVAKGSKLPPHCIMCVAHRSCATQEQLARLPW